MWMPIRARPAPRSCPAGTPIHTDVPTQVAYMDNDLKMVRSRYQDIIHCVTNAFSASLLSVSQLLSDSACVHLCGAQVWNAWQGLGREFAVPYSHNLTCHGAPPRVSCVAEGPFLFNSESAI